MKKIMVYITEDKGYGFRPSKFDFKRNTRIMSKDLGKAITVLGVYDFGENGFIWFKRVFGEIKRSRMDYQDKIMSLVESAERFNGEKGDGIARILSEKEDKRMSERLEKIVDYVENNF